MSPSVKPGSTRLFHDSKPDGGNQRSCTPNMSMSMMPSQKFGNERPKRLPPRIAMSRNVPRFRAAAMPSGRAMTREMSMALPASRSVAGSRCLMPFSTGEPVRKEVPRSPRARSATNATYWVANGRSTPSSARISASCSALGALVPWNMATAGSPLSRIVKETNRVIPSRTSTDCQRRWIRKGSTAARFFQPAGMSVGDRDVQEEVAVIGRRGEVLHAVGDAPQVLVLVQGQLDSQLGGTAGNALQQPFPLGRIHLGALGVDQPVDLRVGEARVAESSGVVEQRGRVVEGARPAAPAVVIKLTDPGCAPECGVGLD